MFKLRSKLHRFYFKMKKIESEELKRFVQGFKLLTVDGLMPTLTSNKLTKPNCKCLIA